MSDRRLNLNNLSDPLESADNEGDFTIDIFSESMNEYLNKLNRAADGEYELDNYDMQVLAVALDQYAKYRKMNCI